MEVLLYHILVPLDFHSKRYLSGGPLAMVINHKDLQTSETNDYIDV